MKLVENKKNLFVEDLGAALNSKTIVVLGTVAVPNAKTIISVNATIVTFIFQMALSCLNALQMDAQKQPRTTVKQHKEYVDTNTT